MASTTTSRIVTEIHDEPHVEGRRVTVRRIQGLVEEAGRSAFDVADELDLDVADVYAALHYYHAHPDEMAEAERKRRRREDLARREGARSVDDYRVQEDGSDGARDSD